MRQPKGFIPIIVVVFIAILASTMVGVSWWYSEKSEEIKKVEQSLISNFDECVAAGNPVMESYPRQCVVNEQTFTEVITNTNQLVGGDADEHGCIGSAGYSWCDPLNRCVRQWEDPCPVSMEPQGLTTDWKTYTNEKYNFSFKYPREYTIHSEAEDSVYIQKALPSNPPDDMGGVNTVGIVVLYNDMPDFEGGFLIQYDWAIHGFAEESTPLWYSGKSEKTMGKNTFTSFVEASGMDNVNYNFLVHDSFVYQIHDSVIKEGHAENESIIATFQITN